MRWRRRYRFIGLVTDEPLPIGLHVRSVVQAADKLRLAMAEDIKVSGAKQWRKRNEALIGARRTSR